MEVLSSASGPSRTDRTMSNSSSCSMDSTTKKTSLAKISKAASASAASANTSRWCSKTTLTTNICPFLNLLQPNWNCDITLLLFFSQNKSLQEFSFLVMIFLAICKENYDFLRLSDLLNYVIWLFVSWVINGWWHRFGLRLFWFSP